MAGKISEQTNMDGAASIDRSADFLEVTDSSGPTTYKATPNFILGITGNPVGHSDVQTLTNKTLTSPIITTPTLTVLDNALTIQDNSDTTKQAQFQLSGITTGQTRTYTLPDASTTLVGTGTTQTLTGKTLTAPTITNPTITVDSLSEFTAAAGITIDGMLIKDGTVGPGTITPAGLVTGTSSTWAWGSWTPTLSGLFNNDKWTKTCKYIQIGKTVFYYMRLTASTTTPMDGAGNPIFSLPVTAAALVLGSNQDIIGHGILGDAGTAVFTAWCAQTSTTTASVFGMDDAAGGVRELTISSSAPMTWTTGDTVSISGFYEAP